MTVPHHRDIAADLGYSSFLPRHDWYPRAAGLALVADRCRRAARGPVWCRNWWRPDAYNARVSSSGPRSDHPHACALDLDYQDKDACQRGRAVLEGLDDTDLLKMSLGLGSRTTHVGMFSPLGPRSWRY
jgi:hypothetical protein